MGVVEDRVDVEVVVAAVEDVVEDVAEEGAGEDPAAVGEETRSASVGIRVYLPREFVLLSCCSLHPLNLDVSSRAREGEASEQGLPPHFRLVELAMPPRPLTPSPTIGRASQDSARSFEAWFEEEDAAAHGAEDDATGQAPLRSSSASLTHASYEQDALQLDTAYEQATRCTGSLEEERRVKRVRRIQLGLACMLSVGSHFGSYVRDLEECTTRMESHTSVTQVLGPVKKALHTSESDFSCKLLAPRKYRSRPGVSSFQGPL